MKNIKINFLVALTLIFISVQSACQNAPDVRNDKTESINNTNKTPDTLNAQVQKPASWINDYEHILDINTIDTLTFLVNDFEAKTAVTIAVVTTATFSPYNSIEDYSVGIGNKWGIGLKEINNGIMVIVSATQRKVRIFTGLGMDQLLSDDAGLKIVNEQMLPYFKQGNYQTGISKGVKEIMRVLLLQATTIDAGDLEIK